MNTIFTIPPIAPNSSSPFKPLMQYQAVATLFLIENSQAMSVIWPDLQDRYLQNIMSRFENANPMTPVTTHILESLPVHSASFPAVPRQYNTLRSGLQDMKFNWDVQNRLSANKILSGVEFLASAEFLGQPSVRHLVIVAASTPVDDPFGIDAMPYSGNTSWHQLARKLIHADIQCHMVLSTVQDMSPLMTLFEETLKLQNLVEELPSFPIDHPQLLFRLSTRPDIYSAAVLHPNPPAQRVPPRRNHSLPLPTRPNGDGDMFSLPQREEPEHPPSLVSQLQQVHGLTKKKVYGAKPVRKPFFREERVRREPSGTPTPLILPISRTPPRSTGSGRALSSSKAARISRVAQSSPTELQPRRPGLPRRNSRMSSPETDSFPSPTSFSIPSNASPPVSPTSPTNMYIQAAPVMPQQPETILDPSWATTPYKPISHSLSQTQFSAYSTAPSPSQATQWQENDTSRLMPRFLHDAATPYTVAGHGPSSSLQALGTDTQALTGIDDAPYRLPRRASCPEDEEPFTFNAEYVAATAAMFKNEILPAYPDLQPAFNEVVSPRRAFYIAQDQGSVPPSPSSPYDPGELYVATERDEYFQQSLPLSLEHPGAATGSPGLSYATSYSPGSSSSLTGWAG